MQKPLSKQTRHLCGTPIRAWSSRRFAWIYYPYQCGQDDCEFCLNYKKTQQNKRILETQGKVPGSFIYKLSSATLSDNLIKRIKHNGGNYLRLSGDGFNYIVSDYEDKQVSIEKIDTSPNDLVEKIINEWPKLRITDNAKEETVSYTITRIVSTNASRSVRDTVFLLSHLLLSDKDLPTDEICQQLYETELKILIMAGYQAIIGKSQLKTSTISQVANGLETNIEKARIEIGTGSPSIEQIVKYIKSMSNENTGKKDFLG